ncbi:carbohydrate kinase family protein [Foetidibacter luteolus]|uniref:carbohydrate kinase family protein n=1 Tax=Foetidibacter luteolus TaxID=2608880 RepID=UPI00129B51E9|nr:carbohydrate kinase [Foetidibacter luteolus]
MKVLCIGEALIDMICTDKGKSLSDGDNFLKKAGGAPTNVAAAIAALGGQAHLAAKVGADPFGRHLVEVMESFGVSTQWVIQDVNHFTTFAFVSLMTNGERDFYFNRGADGQLSIKETEAIRLSDYSIIHFGSATAFLPGPLQETYKALLLEASRQQVFISFDPNYRHLLFQNNTRSFIDQSLDFLQYCHFFKISDEEALLITGKPTLEEAVEFLQQTTRAIFAITIGKDGTMLGINNTVEIIPSIPVKPVDTTGAGDAFVGAVLHQLSDKPLKEILALPVEDWKKVIYNANKAGARTCEYMGAMEAFRHLSGDIFK